MREAPNELHETKPLEGLLLRLLLLLLLLLELKLLLLTL